MKLNGWQRIGIVLSIIWAVGASRHPHGTGCNIGSRSGFSGHLIRIYGALSYFPAHYMRRMFCVGSTNPVPVFNQRPMATASVGVKSLRSALLIAMLTLIAVNDAYPQDAKFTFECDVTGTRMDGNVSTKTFRERFLYQRTEHREKNAAKDAKPWSLSKTEVYSDDKKYENSHVSTGDGYLVFTTVTKTGSGFNQKLLVFTHYIDVASTELERIVTRIPKDAEERIKGRCKKMG